MKFLNNILDYIKNMKKTYKIIAIACVLLIILIATPLIWYNSSLKAVSKGNTPVQVTIEIGSGSDLIATTLEENGVIKSKLAFKLYIKLNNVEGLQAGNYELSKNMNVEEIIQILKTGKVMKEHINITFVEGKNIRWIATKIANSTNNSEQDVYNLLEDEEYVDSLIDEYWFITEDIKNEDIYYPLEGYLFPDTYSFEGKDVSVKDIFKAMLDKMDSVLTECGAKDKDVHNILSLASVVELEGLDANSRKTIASVFYNRLENNMSLGSDVTTYYAYKVDMGERDLTTNELYTYNPYNTRGPQMFGKLPVGPIASPSKSSIEAVINPTDSDYLYFVADKNGKVYFANTLAEHEQIVQDLKNKDLWYVY
ncbi:MAG: endolytic transglycosylase MltG [Clostridia bacterium]|nr:endolytic transglycosylase MltG [Clostridia bacterium]